MILHSVSLRVVDNFNRVVKVPSVYLYAVHRFRLRNRKPQIYTDNVRANEVSSMKFSREKNRS